jgi:hypothetical protein
MGSSRLTRPHSLSSVVIPLYSRVLVVVPFIFFSSDSLFPFFFIPSAFVLRRWDPVSPLLLLLSLLLLS